MRIRGIFLQDYTKVVRDTPDLSWDRYLTPEDWAIVRTDLIPTQWYPVETMARIGRGLFELRSNKNYALVRMAGRARVDFSFDPATKKFLLKGDPAASLRAYITIADRFVDELEVKLEVFTEESADVSFYPVDGAPAWDLFREIQAGTLEKLVEENGGRDPVASFHPQTRQGREACIIRLAWKKT